MLLFCVAGTAANKHNEYSTLHNIHLLLSLLVPDCGSFSKITELADVLT